MALRLWSRGHESFAPEARRILSVAGKGATTYLQGLVTCDLLSPPPTPLLHSSEDNNTEEFSEQLRSACFLDNKGRILTDSLLWKIDDSKYFLDVPGDTADQLLAHLKQFVLRRSKVKIVDRTQDMASHIVYGTLNATSPPEGFLAGLDPRHSSLGVRVLSLDERNEEKFATNMNATFALCQGTYNVLRKLSGVAEGAELTGKIAGECNQEFLNAVSFQKGCYLGQELTARVQYTGAIRKRIMPIFLMDVNMQVPRPWLLASQIQQGRIGPDDTIGGDSIIDLSGASPLPRLSPSTAAGLIGVFAGEGRQQGGDDPDDKTSQLLRAQSDVLFEELQTIECGEKIIDTKDGKVIGQIIAKAEEGTNVLLAQMRLDRVGLLGDGVWSHNNKIAVGERGNDNPLRYLPYLPQWWPDIDKETGKAKE